MAGQGTKPEDYCGDCRAQGAFVPLDRVGIFHRCPECGFSRVMGTAEHDPAGQFIRPNYDPQGHA